ncbi:hypothetical protein DCE93_13390 [Agromyces badenianii]|uniref:Uncharacterized protein n=1 Tax=Agromyces badenianii TaxID=2080742 RepID=A0A2S0WZ91_9MICO|nr:hypothetical protein [Agromyces badenianii]AWB96514.1 hypothetical protein DCE93_13390 [Agromyces badenianii]PWC05390.1 hypothetical protein DCE94_03700 [Agromyces badenianii]
MSGSGERPRLLERPKLRRILARIVVAIGIVLAVIGVVSARYGWLFAGIILVGLGAAMGPARIRR